MCVLSEAPPPTSVGFLTANGLRALLSLRARQMTEVGAVVSESGRRILASCDSGPTTRTHEQPSRKPTVRQSRIQHCERQPPRELKLLSKTAVRRTKPMSCKTRCEFKPFCCRVAKHMLCDTVSGSRLSTLRARRWCAGYGKLMTLSAVPTLNHETQITERDLAFLQGLFERIIDAFGERRAPFRRQSRSCEKRTQRLNAPSTFTSARESVSMTLNPFSCLAEGLRHSARRPTRPYPRHRLGVHGKACSRLPVYASA